MRAIFHDDVFISSAISFLLFCLCSTMILSHAFLSQVLLYIYIYIYSCMYLCIDLFHIDISSHPQTGQLPANIYNRTKSSGRSTILSIGPIGRWGQEHYMFFPRHWCLWYKYVTIYIWFYLSSLTWYLRLYVSLRVHLSPVSASHHLQSKSNTNRRTLSSTPFIINTFFLFFVLLF